MSLKAFHVVFISFSILLALGFGGWLVAQYRQSGEPLWLVAGILSFAVAVSLVFYERAFLKKTRNIRYL